MERQALIGRQPHLCARAVTPPTTTQQLVARVARHKSSSQTGAGPPNHASCSFASRQCGHYTTLHGGLQTDATCMARDIV
ncbi:hypothetical protein BaRGS_00013066 [Batillaria attramentaria]|uniref:Uncharacterized protein n=1 Tax=Batillaria attramentaria TaxID=370345 RepID=A0ABD0L887_9CAEN